MSCTLEFPESSVKIDFCAKGAKQKILIDVLTKHGEMNISNLASTINVSEKKLHDISEGYGFLIGEQADTLAQLFLMFLGKHFLRKCTLIRNFVD